MEDLSELCDGKGSNIAMEQRLHWISKARDLLNVQSTIIQRRKNSNTVKEWRRNKQSFSKSMEKVSRRNEDDIPFAIDIEDYPMIRKSAQKAAKYPDNQNQEELKYISPANINKNIQELVKSLQKLEIAKSTKILTPKSKQIHLQNEIEKLSHFQRKIQNLKRYNEVTLVPKNFSNSSF